ncbi:hypothetical protein KALB_5270 [Kutzneria albida DSM 43870]|uniref:Tc1-like transposase DDE domain-containing protein n=1 Tax=Kutzneria albida DSM 43870 TaxID=1449976 RepID=W5WCQ3_9PSEU|nr:hypothetical protein KALB_5270 [Kutzneria albida DSM 43870]
MLDNLSTHTTPEVMAWLENNPHVRFHFAPKGSSWINQIETWFSIITRQSIRRGTFSSVKVLITQIRDSRGRKSPTEAAFLRTSWQSSTPHTATRHYRCRPRHAGAYTISLPPSRSVYGPAQQGDVWGVVQFGVVGPETSRQAPRPR